MSARLTCTLLGKAGASHLTTVTHLGYSRKGFQVLAEISEHAVVRKCIKCLDFYADRRRHYSTLDHWMQEGTVVHLPSIADGFGWIEDGLPVNPTRDDRAAAERAAFATFCALYEEQKALADSAADRTCLLKMFQRSTGLASVRLCIGPSHGIPAGIMQQFGGPRRPVGDFAGSTHAIHPLGILCETALEAGSELKQLSASKMGAGLLSQGKETLATIRNALQHLHSLEIHLSLNVPEADIPDAFDESNNAISNGVLKACGRRVLLEAPT